MNSSKAHSCEDFYITEKGKHGNFERLAIFAMVQKEGICALSKNYVAQEKWRTYLRAYATPTAI